MQSDSSLSSEACEANSIHKSAFRKLSDTSILEGSIQKPWRALQQAYMKEKSLGLWLVREWCRAFDTIAKFHHPSKVMRFSKHEYDSVEGLK